MRFREFTLGENGVYREQRTVDVVSVIDLLDRHAVNGKSPRRAEIFHKPRFQVAVQGVNETAPTVYVETE